MPAKSKQARNPISRPTPRTTRPSIWPSIFCAGHRSIQLSRRTPRTPFRTDRASVFEYYGAARWPLRSFWAASIRRVVDLRDDSHGSPAVAPDDLNAPLGLGKGKRLPKLPVSPPQILAGALGVSGLVVVGWATLVHDPLGGQPVAVVATKLVPTGPAEEDGPKMGPPVVHETLDSGKAAPPPGSKTVTIIDGSSGARQQVFIPDNSANTAKPLLDSKLLEATR